MPVHDEIPDVVIAHALCFVAFSAQTVVLLVLLTVQGMTADADFKYEVFNETVFECSYNLLVLLPIPFIVSALGHLYSMYTWQIFKMKQQ